MQFFLSENVDLRDNTRDGSMWKQPVAERRENIGSDLSVWFIFEPTKNIFMPRFLNEHRRSRRRNAVLGRKRDFFYAVGHLHSHPLSVIAAVRAICHRSDRPLRTHNFQRHAVGRTFGPGRYRFCAACR